MKSNIKSIKKSINLLSRSIWLDKEFILCKYPQGTIAKIEFISKKYLLLLKHFILKVPVKPGISKIKIGQQHIYFESEYGIANYQAMLVNFQKNFLIYVKHLKKPTIVDLGAHTGLFSLTLSKFFDKPIIYSCEPVNSAFSILKKNTDKTKCINPVRLGFSNRKSKARIYYLPNLLNLGTLFSERFDWGEKPSSEIIRLDTLDSFIKQEGISQIDILKLDTEGAEEKILEGARYSLSKTRYLILECSLDGVDGTTFSSIVHHLYGSGYNFQLVNIQTPFLKSSNHIVAVDMLFENLKLSNYLLKNKHYI